MDRLFLDANVLFSAAWRDESRIRLLWRLQDAVLVTSAHAVEEAVRNLVADDPSRLAALERLLNTVEITPTIGPRPLPSPGSQLPEDDQHILSAAIHTGATHLLTGDKKHFGQFMGTAVSGVLVMRPVDYLASRGAL